MARHSARIRAVQQGCRPSDHSRFHHSDTLRSPPQDTSADSECPLLGAKRTLWAALGMSANSHNRTLGRGLEAGGFPKFGRAEIPLTTPF